MWGLAGHLPLHAEAPQGLSSCISLGFLTVWHLWGNQTAPTVTKGTRVGFPLKEAAGELTASAGKQGSVTVLYLIGYKCVTGPPRFQGREIQLGYPSSWETGMWVRNTCCNPFGKHNRPHTGNWDGDHVIYYTKWDHSWDLKGVWLIITQK